MVGEEGEEGEWEGEKVGEREGEKVGKGEGARARLLVSIDH